MRNRFGDRQAFDPLCSPFRADLVTGHAPHLLRVRFEEGQIQFPPESINQKLLERLLWLLLVHYAGAVADSNLYGSHEAEFLQGIGAQFDRIIEELSEEVNSAFAIPNQHDA